MSARTDLLDLYQEWRTWTDAEAQAIRAGAWNQVNRCQDAKTRLQERILFATEQWQTEARLDRDHVREIDPQLRRVVDELILLELRNGELVEEKRREARRDRQELETSTRNLAALRRSYAPSRQALWQTYS